ncbi:MAG: hypothetical protein RM811_018865, partial [Endozoicomonas sp.]
GRELVESIIPGESINQILNNPVMRFNLIAVRSHGLTASEVKPLQMAGLGLAATGNLINRKYLSSFCPYTVLSSGLRACREAGVLSCQ